MKKIRKKQIGYSFLLSVVISIGLIIHGVFFDLDLTQLKRLNLGGFVITWVIVFVFLLVIEKLFDLNNDAEITNLKKRLRSKR